MSLQVEEPAAKELLGRQLDDYFLLLHLGVKRLLPQTVPVLACEEEHICERRSVAIRRYRDEPENWSRSILAKGTLQ